MYNKGDIVRYRVEWSSPGEREYIHVILENRLNPVTGEMSRYLIGTLNSKLVLGQTETVDECMIEPA